jgi:hypothetical protein
VPFTTVTIFAASLRYQQGQHHVLPKIMTWSAGAGEDRAALSGRPRKANADQYDGAVEVS